MPTLGSSPARRALAAARFTGAAALAAVGQVAVDMPDGYFGASERVTRFGAGYAIALAAATAALLAALWWNRRGVAAWLAPAVLAAGVGLFLPAFPSDPLIAGAVILWHVMLLARHFFPVPEGSSLLRRRDPDADSALAHYGRALRHLAGVSLALSVAVVGYRLAGRGLADAVCLALGYGTLAAATPLLFGLYRAGGRWVLLVALPAVGSVLAAGSPQVMLSLLAVAQAGLLLVLVGREETTSEVLHDFFDRPSRLIAVSFASLIAVGTVLLTFPAAAGRSAVSALDALFTATSAACVTGLIVLDTPHDFSLFGQVVILGLIQVGGLGIMTLSTFGALMLGGTLGLRGERALAEMLDLETAPTAYRLARFIVLSTLAVEAVGASVLSFSYLNAGLAPGEAVWRGVFHAVSAFCNAGFALQTDSIVMFRQAPVPVLTHAVLIVLGGLGFAVLATVGGRMLRRPRRALPVQVRIVLVASAVLLALGAVAYGALEWHRTLDGLSAPEKLLNALFQSVTLRTAGFNTVDFGTLGPATVLLMLGFMFIGASPGSTGGGIKTTTLVVLAASIRAAITRQGTITLYEREVSRDVVFRSLAITVISFTVVGGTLFLLLLFEPQPFLVLLFEATSAFATVGLSLGATAALGPAGKLTIIAAMFIGRIGPLTLALLLGAKAARRSGAVRYPETRMMVG